MAEENKQLKFETLMREIAKSARRAARRAGADGDRLAMTAYLLGDVSHFLDWFAAEVSGTDRFKALASVVGDAAADLDAEWDCRSLGMTAEDIRECEALLAARL